MSGRRPAREGRPSPTSALLGAVARWVSLMLVLTVAVIGGGLYFGPDGVVAMALGLAIWAVLAAGSTAASAAEEGLLTFRTLGLAPAFVALAVLLLPYKSFVLDGTRLQKQWVVVSLALIVALALVVAGMLRNRGTAGSAPPADSPPVDHAAIAAPEGGSPAD